MPEAGWSEPPFEVVGSDHPRVPVIAHVPHSSTRIPEGERAGILLDDTELRREVVRLTDWHADDLFGFLPERGARMLVYRVSRLVLDPERFDDDALEPMARVGQGVVYTRTTQGRPLRETDAAERAELIARLYRPYHKALERLVRETVERFGSCTLLDCHSFASRPLPSEPDRSPGRPDICLGTDAGHTPTDLVDALEHAIRAEGFSVRRDRPFEGTIVPRAYRGDPRFRSVMVEVRRGLYCDEATGERAAVYPDLRGALERALTVALSLAGPTG
jgi:N-formylglutamate deformylase